MNVKIMRLKHLDFKKPDFFLISVFEKTAKMAMYRYNCLRISMLCYQEE